MPLPRTVPVPWAIVRWYTAVPTAAVLTGASVTAYASLYERTRWTLRRFDVPVLAPGSAPLTILQISDLHMTAGQTGKQEWVAALAELEPDLVIDTGDNLAGFDAVPPTLRALDPLLDRPGAFVMGSNDYFAPRPKNPLKYFKRNHKRVHGQKLPWRELRDDMTSRGWLDLDNARGELTVDGRRIVLGGDAGALGPPGDGARRRAHDLAHVLHPRGTGAGDDVGDDRGQVGVVELRGQVTGDHLALGALPLGLLGPAGASERLGGLAALLGLATQHRLHLVVGQLAGLLAGDLLGAHCGEHHAQRRRCQLVA